MSEMTEMTEPCLIESHCELPTPQDHSRKQNAKPYAGSTTNKPVEQNPLPITSLEKPRSSPVPGCQCARLAEELKQMKLSVDGPALNTTVTVAPKIKIEIPSLEKLGTRIKQLVKDIEATGEEASDIHNRLRCRFGSTPSEVLRVTRSRGAVATYTEADKLAWKYTDTMARFNTLLLRLVHVVKLLLPTVSDSDVQGSYLANIHAALGNRYPALGITNTWVEVSSAIQKMKKRLEVGDSWEQIAQAVKDAELMSNLTPEKRELRQQYNMRLQEPADESVAYLVVQLIRRITNVSENLCELVVETLDIVEKNKDILQLALSARSSSNMYT